MGGCDFFPSMFFLQFYLLFYMFLDTRKIFFHIHSPRRWGFSAKCVLDAYSTRVLLYFEYRRLVRMSVGAGGLSSNQHNSNPI